MCLTASKVEPVCSSDRKEIRKANIIIQLFSRGIQDSQETSMPPAHVLKLLIAGAALLGHSNAFTTLSIAAAGCGLRARCSRLSVIASLEHEAMRTETKVSKPDAAHPPGLSKLPLTRRLAVAYGVGSVCSVTILPAQGLCLTEADIIHPSSRKKLPETAYAVLKNGEKICRVQLGLLQLSPKTSKGETTEYWEPRSKEVIDAMKLAVDKGFTTFDLADVYGEAEDYVGIFHETYGFPAGSNVCLILITLNHGLIACPKSDLGTLLQVLPSIPSGFRPARHQRTCQQ